MTNNIQMPDQFQQMQMRKKMEEAGVRQFVADTARELFTGSSVLRENDPVVIRSIAKRSIERARIFTEEALGIRFEENT